MICLFTGIGIGHVSICSCLKKLLNDVQVAFVKEKAHKTGNMDQDNDTDPPNNIPPDNINMDDLELDLVEDVPVANEEVDDNDKGWETENGESLDSEHSMDEGEDED
jgi:hypothetical protein